MKHLFLINPHAGKADCSEAVTRAAEALCGELGEPMEVRRSEAPGHLTELARQAGETGEETRIYACGGDGTLNEVVEGAYGFSSLSVTSFPCGSGNDFIKQFAAPERFFDLRNFRETETRSIDLIDAGGRKAVNIVSVGFDARIGTSIDAYRRHPLLSGSRAYQASILVNFVKGISKPCRLELEDGTVVEGRMTLVCVCNGSWYGGGYNPVPEASMFDGLLDVLVAKHVSRLTVAKVIGAYQKGRYADYPELISHYRTRSLRIVTPQEEPVNVDGELMLAKDLRLTVLPAALRFFAPKGAWM